MNPGNKRKDTQPDDGASKRVKKECMHGDKCYRRNPFHFKEFSHRHLEAILDTYTGSGPYSIPDRFNMDRVTIEEQLDVIVEKQIYTPWIKAGSSVNVAVRPGGQTGVPTIPSTTTGKQSPKTQDITDSSSNTQTPSANSDILKPLKVFKKASHEMHNSTSTLKNQGSNSTTSQGSQNSNTPEGSLTSNTPQGSQNSFLPKDSQSSSQTQNTKPLFPMFSKSPSKRDTTRESTKEQERTRNTARDEDKTRKEQDNSRVNQSCGASSDSQRTNNSNNFTDGQQSSKQKDSSYQPIVPPKRRVEDSFAVVVPKGQMARKHAASGPFHLFYTTITDEPRTHRQTNSITFQEILDSSLGELKFSLQINFMVDLGWLLAHYYFAGYTAKKLTILYGEDSPDLQTISQKKPNIDAHKVQMASPFGTHHTKMMLLSYEDGSLRVVVSTANLYLDDWENRVQGLWFSPRCAELPAGAMPHEGESPTGFKRSLLRYLSHYHLAALSPHVDRVKRCDFSHINVFFVASVPGGHFDTEWGLTRVGALLRQHCNIPPTESRQWPLIAQASSLGSYGKDPNVWLTGDFLRHFTKIKDPPQTLTGPPALKLIYPSLENVRQSHDNLLGGGCLPYGAAVHSKQPWLNNFLYQWRALSTHRDRAMPHIKSYTRVSPDNTRAAYFLLTSGNCSKAAWGSINKGNAALRIMSYEAGVLFLPQFIINEDQFPLESNARNRLILPYDVPPTKYTTDMSPWVMDYLRG